MCVGVLSLVTLHASKTCIACLSCIVVILLNKFDSIQVRCERSHLVHGLQPHEHHAEVTVQRE